jgi:hypothetical protein
MLPFVMASSTTFEYRVLYGITGLSSQASIFEDSAIGIDSDEVQFLLSALWDKVKVRKEGMTLASIGMGLQGIILLKDPIANNLRQYMYLQLLKLGLSLYSYWKYSNEVCLWGLFRRRIGSRR